MLAYAPPVRKYRRVYERSSNRPMTLRFEDCESIGPITSSHETGKKQCMFWVRGKDDVALLGLIESELASRFEDFMGPVIEKEPENDRVLLMVKFPFRYGRIECEFENHPSIQGIPTSYDVTFRSRVSLVLELGYVFTATSRYSGKNYTTVSVVVKKCTFLPTTLTGT